MTNDKDPALEDELRPTLADFEKHGGDIDRVARAFGRTSPWSDVANDDPKGFEFATPRTMADIVRSLEKLRAKSNAEIDRDVEESLVRDGVVTPAAKKAARRQALLDREVKRMGLRLKRRLKRKHGIILVSVECKLGVLERKK